MKRRFKAVSMVVVFILAVILGGCTNNEMASSDSKNRLEAIQERGYIQVVMEPYFAPNQFIDPSKDGDEQYVGSDVELSKYIADKLGVELRIIPLEFAAVLSSITEGKYDLAISALAYTPARAEAMILSDGYYFAENTPGYGLLIREEDKNSIRSPQDLEKRAVVVQSGSLQEMLANEQIPEVRELKRVSSTTDGILMVQGNKADTAVVSISMGQLYIDANPSSGLTIVEDFEFEVDENYDGIRIGIPPGEDELAAAINEIIAEVLESGKYEKWYAEYTEYSKSLGL